jgi:hypothetical protein
MVTIKSGWGSSCQGGRAAELSTWVKMVIMARVTMSPLKSQRGKILYVIAFSFEKL